MENVNYLMKHFSFQGEGHSSISLQEPQKPIERPPDAGLFWIVGTVDPAGTLIKTPLPPPTTTTTCPGLGHTVLKTLTCCRPLCLANQ